MITEADITCPACSQKMTKLKLGKDVIDVCLDGCGGIWFDNYELKDFDNGCEDVGTILENIEPNPQIKVIPTPHRKCPRCHESVLHQSYYSTKKQVIIDKCYTCGGVFLDGGELAQIRALYFEAKDKKLDDKKFAEEMTQSTGMIAEDKIPTSPVFKAYMSFLDKFL